MMFWWKRIAALERRADLQARAIELHLQQITPLHYHVEMLKQRVGDLERAAEETPSGRTAS